MKLIELLKIVDEDCFITVAISIRGMEFTTNHSAGYYIDQNDELNEKKIKKITMVCGEMNILLEN